MSQASLGQVSQALLDQAKPGSSAARSRSKPGSRECWEGLAMGALSTAVVVILMANIMIAVIAGFTLPFWIAASCLFAAMVLLSIMICLALKKVRRGQKNARMKQMAENGKMSEQMSLLPTPEYA